MAVTPHGIIFPDGPSRAVRSLGVVVFDGTQVACWMTLENLKRGCIVRVLKMHQHDLGRTAEALGIHHKTLQRTLRRYGLS